MAVPKDVRMTPKLKGIMELLRGLDTEPYDELLAKFFETLPPPGVEEGSYRPTRNMIRTALGEASRLEVAKALQLQSRVVIHEQGDAVTRQEIPPQPKPVVVEAPKQPPPVKEEAPPITKNAAPKRKRQKLDTKQSSKPARKRERL
jgi:hypothetical protein